MIGDVTGELTPRRSQLRRTEPPYLWSRLVTDDDFVPPVSTHFALSTGTGAGLAGVLIGCALLVSACALMAFNVLLFMRGFRDIPLNLARIGGVIGVGGVVVLGLYAVTSGLRGWSAAARGGESTALGVAGTAAGVVGLIAWLVAGINLLIILFS
jgi:hypothetical protein